MDRRYDSSTDSQPYCACNRWNQNDPSYAGDCAANGLQVRYLGWCSFYGSSGFDACYAMGDCGLCDSAARRRAGDPRGSVAWAAAVALVAWGGALVRHESEAWVTPTSSSSW